MSERGIIVTSPIHDTELREAVFSLVKNWKSAAIVCLSVVAAPGGQYSGCENHEAEQLAINVSELLRSRTDLLGNYAIQIISIPEIGDIDLYIASKYARSFNRKTS